MPAPLSVVLPTLNAARGLPPCAAALMEGLAEGVLRELVVSDGGSTDETLAIARALGAVVVEGPAGQEVARGVAAARGDWLLILRPGQILDPGWAVAARAHMAARPGQGARFRRRPASLGGTLAAAWSRLQGRASPDPVLVPRSQAGEGGAASAARTLLPATFGDLG
jgi:glycosyltransferase involved in cell wall biosynthesis